MDAQDFADQKFAPGTKCQRNVTLAFQREWRSGEARHLDVDRRQRGKPERADFAFAGGKIDRAIIHGFG